MFWCYTSGKEINMPSKEHWIQPAVAKMKEKGTLGSFGKATPKKIAAAKKEGGTMEKKAAAKRKRMGK